jgi:hypothetical protein
MHSESDDDDWREARDASPDEDWREARDASPDASTAGPPADDADDDWRAARPDLDHAIVAAGPRHEVVAAPGSRPLGPDSLAVAMLRATLPGRSSKIAEVFDTFFALSSYNYTQSIAAEKLQRTRRSVVRSLWLAAYCAYHFLRRSISWMIQSALNTCGVRSADGGSIVHTQPLIFVRVRKYDEAQLPLMVDVAAGKDDDPDLVEEFDRCGGKHRVLVLEGAYGLALRKKAASGAQICKLVGKLPCTPQAIERNNGECLKRAMQEMRLEVDELIDMKFMRLIDLHIHDECSSNLRAERSLALDYKQHSPTPDARSSLGFLCDAHKKAQTLGGMVAVVKPFDTQLIRLALSCKSLMRQHLRREVRAIIKEQLVIHFDADPPLASNEHRRAVFDVFLSGQNPRDRYRAEVLGKLFNGDYERMDQIDHYCRGCCASPRETMRLCCTVGVDALFPRWAFPILQRNNWTGSDNAIDTFGLPSHIHGIFEKAYLRCAARLVQDDGGESKQLGE